MLTMKRRILVDDRLENLRWDTVSGNMRDRILHGTQCRMFGEQNPLTKISEENVIAIRMSTGRLKDTAIAFGISEAQVSRIRRFKSRNKTA